MDNGDILRELGALSSTLNSSLTQQNTMIELFRNDFNRSFDSINMRLDSIETTMRNHNERLLVLEIDKRWLMGISAFVAGVVSLIVRVIPSWKGSF